VRLQDWRYPISGTPLLRWRAVYRKVPLGFYSAHDAVFQEAFDAAVPFVVVVLLLLLTTAFCVREVTRTLCCARPKGRRKEKSN
jgi:hypothetical protein